MLKNRDTIFDANGCADERQSAAVYSRIARALAADYFCIYYVDTDSGRYIEYDPRGADRAFDIERGGEDFFARMRRDMEQRCYPADLEGFLSAFTKEKLLAALERSSSFTLTYRMLIDGAPQYVSMKITRMDSEDDSSHIVVGVSNVDAQIKREQELILAREQVNRDALTGVKSKYAFLEAEKRWDQLIGQGKVQPFSVVECDPNGLKRINDTLGHQAGDEHIRGACRIICNIFKHSPVYRTGGDEFTVILSGADHAGRDRLMEIFAEGNREREASGGVIIACGLADYDPQHDAAFSDVFRRADAAMYEDKKRLKTDER